MKFNSLILGLVVIFSGYSHALPVCQEPPGSLFKKVYNLFGSAVTGTQKLKAKSSCDSLGVLEGDFYTLVAGAQRFRIYDIDSFFSHNGNPLINISVPEEGDYITTDTCDSPMISSDEIQSDELTVRRKANGLISITTIDDQCFLNECPKYGACH